MADFLPIGLGRDANGNVSGFQEIKTTDIIPENYLEVNNEEPKWNASGLQGYSVSTTVPTNGYVLTWDSTLNAWKPAAPGGAGNDAGYLNGIEICIDDPSAGQFLVYNAATSSWCPSTYVAPAGGGGGIEGPVSITPGNVVVWGGSPTSVDDGGWYFHNPMGTENDRLLKWDAGNGRIVDSGVSASEVITDSDTSTAQFNANKIQGVSASPTSPTDGQVWVYTSSNNRWTPSTLVLTGGGGGDSNATSIISYPITGTPNNDDVLVFDSGDGDFVWEPRVKSSGTLTANKIIIGDSLGGVSASYATLGTFVDGNVIRYVSGTSAINDAGWGISQSDVTSIGNGRILQWSSSVDGVRRIVDSGYARTDAAWNADKIQNFQIRTPNFNESVDKTVPVWDRSGSLSPLGPSTIAWEYPANLFDPNSLIGINGNLTTTEGGALAPVLFGQTPGGDNQFGLLAPSSSSSIPNGSFLVASGGTFVYAYLPAYLLRFFNTNGTSSFPSTIGPAESLNAQGQLLYYDSTNQRWTNTLNLKVDVNSLSGTNITATSSVKAPTVSATNYLNLPSSTIVWASANYATLAGSSTSALIATNATSATSALIATNATSATSALIAINATSATSALIATNATSATSALNAQQAPAGFTVTGQVSLTNGGLDVTGNIHVEPGYHVQSQYYYGKNNDNMVIQAHGPMTLNVTGTGHSIELASSAGGLILGRTGLTISALGSLSATGSVTASNITTTASSNHIPKAKSSGKIDYTWLEEASIDDFAKAGTTNYTAWYAAGLMTGVALTTFTMTGNRLYAMPFVSPRRGSTVDDIEIYVTTGAATTSAIMGLYTNGGEGDLYPNTLVASSSAELDTTTNAQKRTWNIAYTLNPGQLYWLAVVSNGAPVIRGISTNQAHYILGTASSANTTWTTHLYATHTYDSSLPSTFPTVGVTAGTGAAPGLFYDFSA